MTVAEQASLLGETGKLTKGQVAPADGLLEVQRDGESKENNIKNWLRGIRDSGWELWTAITTAEYFRWKWNLSLQTFLSLVKLLV